MESEIDKIYACMFCDGKKRCWNLKTEKYEPCSYIEKVAALQAELTKARISELEELLPGMTIEEYSLYARTKITNRLKQLREQLGTGYVAGVDFGYSQDPSILPGSEQLEP